MKQISIFLLGLFFGSFCVYAEQPDIRLGFRYEGTGALLSVVSERGTPTTAYTPWTKTFTTADGKLQIRLNGRTYTDFPVTEYDVCATNLSETETTGVVDQLQTADFLLPWTDAQTVFRLDGFRGSWCTAEDFTPFSQELPPGATQELASRSGRSSEDYLPFIELNEDATHGWIFAPRWSGRWNMKFTRMPNGTAVQMGIPQTHFRLRPGESILQPGLTVFRREGLSRRAFQTLVHRFMVQHKAPRDANGATILPILAVASGGGNKTPEMMLAVLKYVLDNRLPFDTYWIDAGWHGAPHLDDLYSNCGSKWLEYRGDWRVNTGLHPTGTLQPIADAVHAAGMKLLVWFEPELVSDAVPIRTEHPEYCNGNLLNLGNPAALQAVQEPIYRFIEQHQLDVYRQDFGIVPAGHWDALDAEDDPQKGERLGIAEARHIAGMYQFLDEMRRRFPNILQENCASGGRRMDMALAERAHVYCRSDFFIGQKPDDQAFHLGQLTTRNTMAYFPFQGCEFNCVPVGDDYGAFSIISSGTVCTFSDFDRGVIGRDMTEEETVWFRKIFDTAARMKPYFLGDFYPLTEEATASNAIWCGWQFHRADQNAGFALVFRRSAAKDAKQVFALGGIDSNADYQVETYGGSTETVSGKTLAEWTVSLPLRGFRLIFYQRCPPCEEKKGLLQ